MTEVIEILPQLRQERAYFTWSISWVLMPWQHKEPGHQQPWCWLCWTESIRWYQATTKLMWLMNEAVQWDIVFLCSFVFTRAAILSHGNSELHDLHLCRKLSWFHYSDVITSTTASQVTSLTIVYWTVYSGADQKKNLSSASLVFVWGIHQWPVTFPAQRTSNVANVSIWWRHHVEKKNKKTN